jgi:hypothetical protein
VCPHSRCNDVPCVFNSATSNNMSVISWSLFCWWRKLSTHVPWENTHRSVANSWQIISVMGLVIYIDTRRIDLVSMMMFLQLWQISAFTEKKINFRTYKKSFVLMCRSVVYNIHVNDHVAYWLVGVVVAVSWSYGNFTVCNQCLSPLMLWVRISIRAMCTTLFTWVNVIKFVSDLRQVGGFLRVLRFPPSIKLTATI